jgi:monoamine oxidase
MARTPTFRRVKRALATAIAAERRGVPSAEYLELAGARLGRRRFLQGAAGAAALAAVPACTRRAIPTRTDGAPIAIIGAGAAGLTCAYRLQQAGIASKVFDSWNRVGGRMFTARGMWLDDQIAELGGELIDTTNEAIRRLAAELELTLDPLLEAAGSGIRQDSWFFDGQFVSDERIVEAFRPFAARLAADAVHESGSPEFDRLDRLGLAGYLDSAPDLDPMLRKLIEVAYVGEYGREAEEQSAWNLLWLIDHASPEPFRIYGDSDEALHVRGGNDLIPAGLASRLSSPVMLEHRLVRVVENGSSSFTLSFDRGSESAHEETFARVVFALPFTRLREVEMVPALPPAKKEIVDTLGMGMNAKLMSQYGERVWRTRHRASGSVTTDNGLQTIWETSRAQEGRTGILTVFAGGRIAEEMGRGTADGQIDSRLAAIDQIFPGTGETYQTGRVARMHWPTVDHTRGSYSCFLPGQARFAGREGERAGNLHFCGEQTSVESQGMMNGAVESGERVAREIVSDIG